MYDNWKDALSIIPEHMRQGMELYIERGVKPGSFMSLIMENDFVHAFIRADEVNRQSLPLYAQFLYEYAPQECWGTRMRTQMWMARGGLQGIAAARAEVEEN